MSSHWHYQLMKHPDGSYAIHEMYHFSDGCITWTENPVTVTGESIEDVKKSLLLMLNDADKHGVRDHE